MDDDDPRQWLGDTRMLNLRDDKLRLRVVTVTQFSRNDREKLRAICHYVASIPFDVPPFAAVRYTRQTLSRRHAVGWYSKAGLFQAMLRVAGFPARVKMLKVGYAMYRGLADDRGGFVLPVVEVHTEGRWVLTDNYVYDVAYLAVAREAAVKQGWNSGYGVYLDGNADWDGASDALVMAPPKAPGEEWPLIGPFDDAESYANTLKSSSPVRWLSSVVRNRLMTIRISTEIRRLRKEAGG